MHRPRILLPVAPTTAAPSALWRGWSHVARMLLPGLVGLALTAAGGRATTVNPPEFPQLVGQSEYVVRAVVKSATAEWQLSGNNRHIVTQVELEVLEVIAGTPPTPLVLTMLGGRIGGMELRVDGAPKFRVGDEDIIFVRKGSPKLFPLVALMHGRYPVVREAKTGAARVTRSNGVPLYSEQDVAKPLASTAQQAAGVPPLTPEAFAGKIRTVVQEINQQQQE